MSLNSHTKLCYNNYILTSVLFNLSKLSVTLSISGKGGNEDGRLYHSAKNVKKKILTNECPMKHVFAAQNIQHALYANTKHCQINEQSESLLCQDLKVSS